jgi:hypothetical protein
MTIKALQEGVKKRHSIYLKPIKLFIVDIDKETGEETKHPTPDALPLHSYEVVGPFNKQVKNFKCMVVLSVSGSVERVY